MTASWLAYNELAWTEDLLADPAGYEEEARVYIGLIRQAAEGTPQTLLHLGSGAGGLDHFFKSEFAVTGVDLSPGMLQKARTTHPDIEYIEGDMRAIRLDRRFDVVAIPDSIDYMASPDELRQAIETAVAHLRPGGVLLVVAKPAETFQDNNFAYTGARGELHLTLLENNYVNPYRPGTYEATLVYLVRQRGALTMHTDRHVLGLFPRATWERLFESAGLAMRAVTLDGSYDQYLLGDGSYSLTVFVGRRNS